MNRSFYRLVFDTQRGMLVPVCETAAAHGKRASRNTGAGVAVALAMMGSGAAGAATAPPPLPVAPKNFVQQAIGTVAAPKVVGKTMTITQTADAGTAKAVVNWNRFDIAKGYTVKFDQPTNGVILNKVTTPSGAYPDTPAYSVIQGSLNATGTIYLYNQNGILFDKGSQVNVGGLVATSLKVDEKAFWGAGIFAGGRDSSYGNTGSIPALNWAPDFNGVSAATQTYLAQAKQLFSDSKIKIEPGAQISVLPGGIVMLAAPTIENRGAIANSGGQTILAAGGKVYLAAPSATDTSDFALTHGFLVEVGPYTDNVDPAKASFSLPGVITNAKLSSADLAAADATDPAHRSVAAAAADALAQNGKALASGVDTVAAIRAMSGEITAERGKINLVALAINQQGRISATTSLVSGGAIFLQARQAENTGLANVQAPVGDVPHAEVGGTLTLGQTASSESGVGVTEVIPEKTTETQAGVQASSALPIVEMSARSITFAGSSQTRATGGSISVKALSDLTSNVAEEINVAKNDKSPLGSVALESGALLDVSGADGSVSATTNFLSVGLFGQELADSPLQRTGLLYRRTVSFDARKNQGKGLTIANVTKNIAAMGLTLEQRLAQGGQVSIVTSGAVSQAAGAKIDVSGGTTTYTAGTAQNTHLISTNGADYDIADAPAGLSYRAAYDVDVAVPGYQQGADAGKISITAPLATLQGTLAGRTTVGDYQRTAAPKGGQFVYLDPLRNGSDGATPITGRKVVIGTDGGANAIFTLAPDRLDGIASVTLQAQGEVDINAPLVLPTGGALAVQSDTGVRAAAEVTAHGGSIDLETAGTGKSRGVVLAPGVLLDVSGTWTNDFLNPASDALDYNGGSVILKSLSAVSLGRGAAVDASGGGWLSAAGKFVGGTGGLIALGAKGQTGSYLDNGLPSYVYNTLDLSNAQLTAYGYDGKDGGQLSLVAPSFTVDAGSKSVTLESDGNLKINPAFFSQGGFKSFDLDGARNAQKTDKGVSLQGGVTVKAGTQLTPSTKSLLLDSIAGLTGANLPSGARLADLASVYTGIENLRPAVSMTLHSEMGAVRIEKGALVATEGSGSLSLAAPNSIYVDGTLRAPGGTISLALSGEPIYALNADGAFSVPKAEAAAGNWKLWLGSDAVLDASGIAQVTELNGVLRGKVLDGGTVKLSDNYGFIVAEQGSRIVAAGASAQLDLPTRVDDGIRTSEQVQRRTVDSQGGVISLTSGSGLLFDASVDAHAGGAGATGGSFSAKLAFHPDNVLHPDAAPDDYKTLVVTQPTLTISADGGSSTGAHFEQTLAPSLQGTGRVSAQSLAQGGFADISLRSGGSLHFSGQTTLDATRSVALDAPELRIDNAALAKLTVNAPSVTLENSDTYLQNTTFWNGANAPGAGTITLNAGSVLDITGKVRVDGAKALALTAGSDLRLNGVIPNGAKDFEGGLQTGGAALTLTAGQLYPSSGTQFVVDAGSNALTIQGFQNADTQFPYAVGGDLTLKAQKINQNGIVRAPFGHLVLDAGATGSVTLGAGSETSVAAPDGFDSLYGWARNGTDWVLGTTTETSAPIDHRIEIKGAAVAIKGAQGKLAAAKVDVSGGGTLSAYQFLPGLGGSKDYLSTTSAGVERFAILPGYKADFAPLDGAFNTDSVAAKLGRQVYLSGIPGVLAAGVYTLLPARYALLPGAFVVSTVAGGTDFTSVRNAVLADGSATMSGQIYDLGQAGAPSRTQEFLVEPAATVHAKSEFKLFEMDAFFNAKALASNTVNTRRAADAGSLSIATVKTVQLGGSFDFSVGAGGVGGEFALAAPNLAVLGASGKASGGEVGVSVSALNAMGVRDLILGGSRDPQGDGTDALSVGASSVRVDTGGETVQATDEVLLVAKDHVSLVAGSKISTTGAGAGAQNGLDVAGDNAIVRVAAENAFRVKRSGIVGTAGDVAIGDNVALRGGTIEVDASHATSMGRGDSLSASDISLATQKIGLGGTSESGLTLSGGLISQLGLSSVLQLRAYDSIDLYGALGDKDATGAPLLDTLILDTPMVRGTNSSSTVSRVVARSVVLQNTQGSDPESADWHGSALGEGKGTLEIDALARKGQPAQIVLGEGSHSISGFVKTNLNSAGDVKFSGAGGASGTRVHGDLTISAARVTADQLANQSLTVSGSLVDQQASTTANGEGGKFATVKINAAAVDWGGVFDLPAGDIALQASAAAGVHLRSGARLSVAGVRQDLGSSSVYIDGGNVALTADTGDVTVDAGSVISVSAHPEQGNAGSVAFKAPAGQVLLQGSLSGQASVTGLGGALSVDALTLTTSSLNSLIKQASTGGFNTALQLRARSGDLTLDETSPTIKAQTVELDADGGIISVASRIDASGASGGRIALWGNGGVHLAGSAVLDAHATGADAKGGSIVIAADQFNGVDGQIAIDSGARISAAGSGVSGGPDDPKNGSVLLRARWEDDPDKGIKIGIGNIGNAVDMSDHSHTSLAVEAVRVYDGKNLIGVTVDPSVALANQLSIGTPTDFSSALTTALKAAKVTAPSDLVGLAATTAYFLLPVKTASARAVQATKASAYASAVAMTNQLSTLSDSVSGAVSQKITDALGLPRHLSLSEQGAVLGDALAAGMSQIGIDSVDLQSEIKTAVAQTISGGGTYAMAASAATATLAAHNIAANSLPYLYLSGSDTMLKSAADYLNGKVADPNLSTYVTGAIKTYSASLVKAQTAAVGSADATTILNNALTSLGVDKDSAGTIAADTLAALTDSKGNLTIKNYAVATQALAAGLTNAGYGGDTESLISKFVSTSIADPKDGVYGLFTGTVVSTVASAAADNSAAIAQTVSLYERIANSQTIYSKISGSFKTLVCGTKTCTATQNKAITLLNTTLGNEVYGTDAVSTTQLSADLQAVAKTAKVTVSATTLTNTIKGQLGAYDAIASALGTDAKGVDGVALTTLKAMQPYSDVQAFMSYSDQLAKDIGVARSNLRSGIEVRSTGNLNLLAGWDFTATATYAGNTVNLWKDPNGGGGALTLRAGGDLMVGNNKTTQSLSDNFSSSNVLQSGPSWSYRLVGGADLTAASALEVVKRTSTAADGDVLIGSEKPSATGVIQVGSVVRTGTGSIEIAAGRNVRLVNADSVVYTAGRPLTTTTAKNTGGMTFTFVGDPADAQAQYYFQLGGSILGQQFAQGGGDIRISAGNDVLGADASALDYGGQFINNWLWRQGTLDASGAAFSLANNATAWWIKYDQFKQNIGSFGGGDISVVAGRNVDNLSVMVPTTGYTVDTLKTDGALDPSKKAQVSTDHLVTLGGGDLSVRAGGDLKGGQFLVMQGQGSIVADGSVTEGKTLDTQQRGLFPVLGLGDGQWAVQARGDLAIEAVVNPTLLLQAGANSGISTLSYFSTYGSNSGVSLTSVAGATSLIEGAPNSQLLAAGVVSAQGHPMNGAPFYDDTLHSMLKTRIGTSLDNAEESDSDGFLILPSRLRLTSLAADVDLFNGYHPDKPLLLIASPQSAFEALANNSVYLHSSPGVKLSDMAVTAGASETVLVSPKLPASGITYENAADGRVPLHAAGSPAVVVTAVKGDVVGVVSQASSPADGRFTPGFSVDTPTSARISAGRDIIDFSLSAQNVADTDLTSVTAGRDIIYTPQADSTGGAVRSGGTIKVAGPGQLELTAGRNIDLGTADGVVTTGNLYNKVLSAQGASITMTAGAAATLNTDAFVTRYLDTSARADAVVKFATEIYPLVGTDIASVSIKSLQATVTPERALYLAVLRDWIATWQPSGVLSARDSREQQALSAFLALPKSSQQAFVDAHQASYLADLSSFLKSAGAAPVAQDAGTLITAFRQLAPTVQAEFAAQITAKEFQTNYLTASSTDDTASAALKTHYAGEWQAWGLSHGVDTAHASATQVLAFARQVMVEDLRTGGEAIVNAAAASGTSLTAPSWARTYAALDAAGYGGIWTHTGDIGLSSSLVSTQAGGNIALFTPGGGVNLGLITPDSAIEKSPANQGIIALGTGSIDVVARDDIQIVTSRIFTVGGGDILLYSSHGSVDAGKGSRSAQIVPPPRVTVDPNGHLLVSYSNSITGSGIGALKVNADTPDATVDLFAPLGEINAGDAGISSSGKITLGAQALRNTDVIKGGSLVVSVPVVVAPPPPPAVPRTADKANQQLEESSTKFGEKQKDPNSILTVELLGVGDNGSDNECADKPGSGKKPCAHVDGSDTDDKSKRHPQVSMSN